MDLNIRQNTMEEINKIHEKDQAITNLQQLERSHSVMTKPVKLEEDVELKSNLQCSTNSLIGGSKSKQHLTEVEKEARRLRRILANRESARQTIRRRQAMFEELNKKAVDLEVENDNLKKDKELAMKEYESLENTNNCLKAQVTKMLKPEPRIEEKQEPSNNGTSTSEHRSAPSFPYNNNVASALPFYWPMMVQPPEASSVEQCRSESGIATPTPTPTPLVPMMQLWKSNSFLDQGNSVVVANPGTFLCVLPFPCFFPFQGPAGASDHLHSSGFDQNQKEASSSQQQQHNSAGISSKQKSNCDQSLPLKPSTEVVLDSGGTNFSEEPHEARFSLSLGGNGTTTGPIQHQGIHCIRPVASIGPFAALHQNDNPTCTDEDTSETISDDHERTVQQPGKEGINVVAAAEARRKRKELMKLKNPHGSQ